MSNLIYDIGNEVEVTINGQQGKAKIIGFEMAWWLAPSDWLYHVLIDEYSFTLKITQGCLVKGANIWTNGRTARILNDAKSKAK